MCNDNRIANWKIIIGIDNNRNAVSHVYGVTYKAACESAQRQIEGTTALSYLVVEA